MGVCLTLWKFRSGGVGGGGGDESLVPYKYEKSREVGGGGELSEIPPVVGYGYFLEPHIA